MSGLLNSYKILRSGFTIVELIIAISVIAILAASLSFGYSQYLARARDAERVTSVSAISNSTTLYYSANDRYPPFNGSNEFDGYSGPLSDPQIGCINTGALLNYIKTMPYSPSGASYDEGCGENGQYAYGVSVTQGRNPFSTIDAAMYYYPTFAAVISSRMENGRTGNYSGPMLGLTGALTLSGWVNAISGTLDSGSKGDIYLFPLGKYMNLTGAFMGTAPTPTNTSCIGGFYSTGSQNFLITDLAHGASLVSNVTDASNPPNGTTEHYLPYTCTNGIYSYGSMSSTVNCDTGYSWDGSACTASTQTVSCGGSIPTNATETTATGYTQTWDGSAWNPSGLSWTYGAANCGYTCDLGYHTEDNATCISNTQSCTVANGSGNQTWDVGTNSWGSCTVTNCDTGYTLSGGACLPAACTTSWGASLANGSSVTAYQSSSVAYPATCISETQTCTLGTISGSYTNPACSVTYTYSWNTGSYGSCSVSCGGGTQTRSVTCRRNDGTTVADSYCSSPKPATSQSCNTQSCSVNGACGTSANTCAAGTPGNYASSGYGGYSTWRCYGSGGGSTASCSRYNGCVSYYGQSCSKYVAWFDQSSGVAFQSSWCLPYAVRDYGCPGSGGPGTCWVVCHGFQPGTYSCDGTCL